MVPRVVQGYIARLPEVTNNAYNYFNYDHRIIDERVDRHDAQSCYRGPNKLADADYDALVKYAATIVNPVLLKYSPKVANEDALSTAIKSFQQGMFDGKINANKYNVLLDAMGAHHNMADYNNRKMLPIL